MQPKTAHEAQSSLRKFFGSSNSVSLSQLARDIFLWFADGLIPFSLIESDGTKLFLAKYCKISPDQIPGRMAISRAGGEVYRDAKSLLQGTIAADDHLAGATSFDIWTCKHSKRSFMGLTYHFVDRNFCPQKILLSASFFPHPHNYQTINDWIVDVFEDFKISRSRIHVTDEASNNKKFAHGAPI